MRPVVTHALLIGWLVSGMGARAWADSGTVRLSHAGQAYRFTAFTEPTPLRAGPIDVSLLVCEADSGDPVDDVTIEIRARATDVAPITLAHAATRDQSGNRLFYAAKFALPAAGQWTFEVQVAGPRGREQARFELAASDPLPRWRDLWLWFTWPALVVAAFIASQWTRKRCGTLGHAAVSFTTSN